MESSELIPTVEKLKSFDQNNYKNRKYNSNNFENGLKFYKMRYLKTKITETPNKNFSSSIKEQKYLLTLTKEEKQRLLEYEKINSNNEINIKIKIQKYTYLFLILIEKSVIYFNFKHFKESYDILYDYGIIQNKFEFGELLLVINGYDKILKGEYITKRIESNNNDETSKGFIESIEMGYFENLFECFRFIYSRINIPSTQKESFLGNILIYYKNEISKLKLEKKKEIKNKEDILKYYNDIINKPFSFYNDYLSELYQRFSILLDESKNKETNNKEIKDIKFFEKKEYYYIYLEEKEFINEEFKKKSEDNKYYYIKYNFTSFDNFSQKEQQTLTIPITLFRISGSNATNSKEYLVLENFTKMAFEKKIDSNFKIKHSNSFLIDNIVDIYMGTRIGENFKKYLKSFPKEEKNQNNYISIILNKEQIDLKSNDPIELLRWYRALKCLVCFTNKNKKKMNEKNGKNKNELDENRKMKEEFELIWNNYILGKWETYGNYLLFKSMDSSNYFPDLPFEGKPENSKTKNELLEDKKNPYIKAISNFLKETKDKINKKGILEYNEFITFCQLGISDISRKKIWPILIGNKNGISYSLYKSIKEIVAPIINFNDFEVKYKENTNINFSENTTVNKMIKDIIKIKYIFLNDILENKIEINRIMIQVYIICRCFYLQRFDIPYNKNIIYIIFFLLINKISEEDTFIMIFNLICSKSFMYSLYICENKYITNIFEDIITKFKELLPKLYEHFDKLGIGLDLYLTDWLAGFFTQSLNIKIASSIFDLYLIYGEYILFQTSFTILKLLEKDLLNCTIEDTLKKLKIMPLKFDYYTFFDTFKNFYFIKEKFMNTRVIFEFLNQKDNLYPLE